MPTISTAALRSPACRWPPGVLQVMRTGHTPATASERAERIAALTQSNAELATLSRNIAHLTALLRQGEVRAAQEYRQMLDTLATDIRQHLKLAAQLLAAERREAKQRHTHATHEDPMTEPFND